MAHYQPDNLQNQEEGAQRRMQSKESEDQNGPSHEARGEPYFKLMFLCPNWMYAVSSCQT